MGNHSNKGRDHKVGDRHKIIQRPQDYHRVRRYTDLLKGLAQGSGLQVGIVGITSTTGKGNLALVMLDMLGALGNQYMPFPVLQ